MLDECEAYNGPERRNPCSELLVLRQRFEDEERERQVWREKTDAKLEKIINFLSKLEGPYNAGMWSIRIFLGAIILATTGFLIKVLGDHFK